MEKAVLSGHSERGWHVLRQTRDLAVIVDDPNHKIVRWRLLPPVVGKVLRLPDWATLGLAHVGCALWLTWMYAIFRRAGLPEEDRPWDGFFTVLIIGATAPFFRVDGLAGIL